MKMKKILAMSASFALVAALAIGGTMAYIQTEPQNKSNVFSVGNVDIVLKEDTGVTGGGTVTEDETGATYTEIMPGDYLKKEVTVENTGTNPAYVQVTVTVNNFKQIQNIIENCCDEDDCVHEEALLDYIFDGWGMTVQDRYLADGTKDMSYKINEWTDENILQVDSAKRIVANEVAHFSIENWFKSPAEEAAAGYTIAGTANSYYLADKDDYSLCYTYYIYLPEKGDYATLFNGLNVPSSFTSEELAMFEDLEINVEAKAIQADNFSSAKAAFVTLNADNLIETDAAFKEALSQDVENIVVVLSEDVTYDVAEWSSNGMGGASTKTITIYGNGHTINFNQTNSDWNNVVTNNNATLIINDAVLTNSGNNDGPWNSHDINFACAVELNNIVSDKAFAFKSDATLNGVTIADANTSDTYAIWIQPNGQTVTLDNCTIDMLAATDGRGIKIDEQYVTTPEKVTLNVSNTKFMTEEKSAIIVKSKAGALINVENINIENTIDKTNAVWVDEASAEYYNLVVVNGATKILEPEVVSDISDLKDALNKGEDVLLTEDVETTSPITVNGSTLDGGGNTLDSDYVGTSGWGQYAIVVNSGTVENITVVDAFRGIGSTNTTGDVYIKNVTIDNVTYAINGNGTGTQNVYVSDSTIYGWNSYADINSINFTNCTLGKGNSYAGYMVIYGTTNFTNCNFEDGYAMCGDLRGTLDTTVTFTNCTYDGSLVTADNFETLFMAAGDETDFGKLLTNYKIVIDGVTVQ